MLKAALTDAGVPPPRTHDLSDLDALLPGGADRPITNVVVLGEVSYWAVAHRYDVAMVKPSQNDVEAVLDAAETYLARRGW